MTGLHRKALDLLQQVGLARQRGAGHVEDWARTHPTRYTGGRGSLRILHFHHTCAENTRTSWQNTSTQVFETAGPFRSALKADRGPPPPYARDEVRVLARVPWLNFLPGPDGFLKVHASGA